MHGWDDDPGGNTSNAAIWEIPYAGTVAFTITSGSYTDGSLSAAEVYAWLQIAEAIEMQREEDERAARRLMRKRRVRNAPRPIWMSRSGRVPWAPHPAIYYGAKRWRYAS